MATQIDLGAVVPIGKGNWNPSTTYERANIVRHNSVAWICKVATSLGVEPTEDSSDWYLLVKDTSSVISVNGMRGDVTIDSVLKNPSIDDNSLKIASTAWTNTKISNVISAVNQIQSEIKIVLPVGSVIAFAANSNPEGYLICNGAAVSRTIYANLYAKIGDTYGAGDGLTTFNLPNLIDRFIQGASTAGTTVEAGLPNIIGDTGSLNWSDNDSNALDYDTWLNRSGPYERQLFATNGEHIVPIYTQEPGLRRVGVNFNASRSNPVYGRSDTVQPPALTMRYYIKY